MRQWTHHEWTFPWNRWVITQIYRAHIYYVCLLSVCNSHFLPKWHRLTAHNLLISKTKNANPSLYELLLIFNSLNYAHYSTTLSYTYSYFRQKCAKFITCVYRLIVICEYVNLKTHNCLWLSSAQTEGWPRCSCAPAVHHWLALITAI